MTTLTGRKSRDGRARRGVELPDHLDAGFAIGPWIVEHVIGRGGMSTVYAVHHREFGKRAALKLANRDVFGPRFTADRFLLEARVVNTVDHPDVVDIFDAGWIADRPYLVMERLTGETLGDRLERGPIPHDEVCAILLHLCEILGAAHDAGVVHRDLKLDNVFLANERGRTRIKLLDWGLANLAGEDPMADMIAGTPHYVAPEQVRGETVTARSDIYSLGVLAYVLFLGRAPFDHESSAEILKQHVRLLPPPPKERWADIPPALDATILAMLAKDPHARPALGEIAKVLRAARPGATPPPLPLAARGTRPPVAAASVGYETLEIVPADVLGRMVVLPTLEKRWWIGAAVAAGLLAGGLAWRLATGGRVAAAAPVRPAPALVTAAPVAGGEGRLDVAPPVSFDPIAQAIAMLDAGRATCAPAMLACPPVAAPEP